MTPSQLYSRIAPFVQGCPEPTIDQAVMDAVTEFAERTQIAFSQEAPIPLRDGVSTYHVFPLAGLDIAMVRHVFCRTRELRKVTPTSLHDAIPDWQTISSSEPTHYGTFEEPGAITVYPKVRDPNGATLVVMAAWQPAFGATSFPDDIGRRFYRDIVEGAKAHLLLMPDRKWTNPALAGVARANFEAGIADARIKAIHSNSAGTITARPQRFGG